MKKQIKKVKTVEVPVEWFKGLLKVAKDVENRKPNLYNKYDPWLHQFLPLLLGYIQSAEYILPTPSKKEMR